MVNCFVCESPVGRGEGVRLWDEDAVAHKACFDGLDDEPDVCPDCHLVHAVHQIECW